MNEAMGWAIALTVVCGGIALLFLAIGLHEDRKLQKILAIGTAIVWGLFTLGGLALIVFLFFCPAVPSR